MSLTAPVLKVEKLSYRYPSAQQDALYELSLEIKQGCFHALLGPNGAGKTTLFSLITDLLKLQKGTISIMGSDIKKQALLARSKMGVVFQQPTLDLDLTVEQNLKYFAALNGLGSKQAKHRISQELERFELTGRCKDRVRQLNGGHRRRIEIARALLHEPQLLLFDEATVGLDVPTRQQIINHTHRLCQEKNIAVFWATHLVDEVFENDEVTLLDKGLVVEQGRCHHLLAKRNTNDLKQLFIQLTEQEPEQESVAL